MPGFRWLHPAGIIITGGHPDLGDGGQVLGQRFDLPQHRGGIDDCLQRRVVALPDFQQIRHRRLIVLAGIGQQAVDPPGKVAGGHRLRAGGIHHPGERRAGGIFDALVVAGVNLDRLHQLDEGAQRGDVTVAGEAAQHHLEILAVGQAVLLQLETENFQPAVHILHILHPLRRPQPLGDRGGARPDARVDRLRRHQFPPTRRLAPQDRPLFLFAQRGIFRDGIVEIMKVGRLHQVDVIAVGEDAHVALLRRLHHRFLAPPGMDHRSFGKIGMEDLVPADHFFAVLSDNFQNALIEITLQRMIVRDVVLFHERLDILVGVPVLAVVLIAPDMQIFIREQPGHLGEELIEEIIDRVAGGIEYRVHDAPVALDGVRSRSAAQFRVTDQPAGGVGRHVELRHHPDAAVIRIGDDLADLFLGEVESVGAHFMQFRKGFRFDPEALVVHQVPVQHVQLHRRHAVEVAFEHLHWHEVAADVDQQSPPGKARGIDDLHRRKKISFFICLQQLQQGLQSPQRPDVVIRLQLNFFRGDGQAVGFIRAQLHHPGAAAVDHQVGKAALAGLGDVMLQEEQPGASGEPPQEAGGPAEHPLMGLALHRQGEFRIEAELAVAIFDLRRHRKQGRPGGRGFVFGSDFKV